MQLFLENLPVICLFIALLVCLICCVYSFVNLPREKQIKALKEWLKWAVSIAEEDLGSGTGQLKLRQVYGMAMDKFPWLARVFTFEQFSMLVDEALEWMRNQIDTNPAFKALINNANA